MSSTERDRIEAALAALEAQRATLGDAVIDAAVQGLRTQLAAIDQAALPAPQALKQVTILFLDIVGSTQLSQSLDPEETHAVMDGALLRLTAIVTAHGGKVLQYAGDNLLAVFGAEESREDDPERLGVTRRGSPPRWRGARAVRPRRIRRASGCPYR
jgi:class 3 adenylate cyclase